MLRPTITNVERPSSVTHDIVQQDAVSGGLAAARNAD